MNTPEWVHEPEAAKRLALKQNTLRTMRRERRLEPGKHWVFATGAIGGPVVYNIPAVRKSLGRSAPKNWWRQSQTASINCPFGNELMGRFLLYRLSTY